MAHPKGKAWALLGGRPLIWYPVQTLLSVCDQVAVVCKPQTILPKLDTERWEEPESSQHPLVGICHALRRAEEPILVCGADMPFITGSDCRRLIAALREPAVCAAAGGRLEPLFAIYTPSCVSSLQEWGASTALTRAVSALDPATICVCAENVQSINTRAQLAWAQAKLAADGGR